MSGTAVPRGPGGGAPARSRLRLGAWIASLVALVATAAPAHAGGTAPPPTPLPDLVPYQSIAVDDANSRVFVSGAGRTAVLDFDGKRIDTLPSGGDSFLLTSDPPTLYMALGGSSSILSFDRTSLEFLTSVVVFPAVPLDLVRFGGRFWFADGCGLSEVGLASVELDGDDLRRFAGDDFPTGCPQLAAVPGQLDQLLMADRYFEPPRLYRYELVDGAPVLRARNEAAGPPGARLEAFAVTPDGSTAIAAGSPTSLRSFDTGTLSPAGLAYPMQGSSNAVALSSDGSLVAGGREFASSAADVIVFARGTAALGRTWELGENTYVSRRGLAFSADRSRLFVVARKEGVPVFFALEDPHLRETSLSLSSSPSPVAAGGQVTVNGRLADLNGDGVGARTVEIVKTAPGAGPAVRAAVPTDGDGRFSYTDPDPLSHAGGTYAYEAQFTGDELFTPATRTIAVQVAKRKTTVALRSSHRSPPHGRSVILGARLTGAPGGVVSIFAKPYGQARTLLKAAAVDAGGNVAASYRMQRKTTFTAEYAGDSAHARSSVSLDVHVRALIQIALSGNYGVSGKYALYRPRTNPKVTATVVPRHVGQRVKFVAQKLVSGSWTTTGTARFPIRRSGSAVAFLYAVGGTYRVRVAYGGDTDHLGATSPWRYLKVG